MSTERSKLATRARAAIVLPINATLYRNSMRGISQWVSETHRWEIRVFDSYDLDPAPLIAWRPDAILARAADHALPPLLAIGVPTVTLSMDEPLPNTLNVCIDDRQIGRLAAEHFIDRHFEHLAYAGIDRVWSKRRFEGFADAARLAGLAPPAELVVPTPLDDEALVEWVKSLPRPLGLLSCHDDLGVRILDVFAAAGIRVPAEVAVLGVDNFEYQCDLTTPPLSSVINPMETVASEAFRLLERLHDGVKITVQTIAVPSTGIVTRGSTDTAAVIDDDVGRALQIIRSGIEGPLCVDDVARGAAISRRLLEYRFRAVLGRSPLEEIRRARIARAKELLGRTRLPMPAIASKCGFSSASQFATVFRQMTGSSPSKYRQSVHTDPSTTDAGYTTAGR